METRNRTRVVLWALSISHLLGGLLFGLGVRFLEIGGAPSIVLAVFVGLVFAQVGVVGIWFALGTSPHWVRIIGTLGAMGYLIPQFGLSIDELDWYVAFIVVFIGTMTAVPLFVWRFFGCTLCRTDGSGANHTELQFGIRHIMLLTLAVAVMLAAGRLSNGLLVDSVYIYMILLSVPFILVGVVSVWSTVGCRNPLLGLVTLLIIAAGAGGIVGQFLDEEPVFWAAASVVQALTLTLTLLPLRRYGFRVRRQSNRITYPTHQTAAPPN